MAELRAAAPLADSPLAQPTDYAMWGVATPGEVSAARREDVGQLDDNCVVGSRINRVGPPGEDRDQRNRGIDRG